MKSETLIILLSTIVIISYLADILARKTKLPSVLSLLVLGIILKLIYDNLGFKQIDFFSILPIVGTIGLILIVFEGVLELQYKRSKNRLILSAFLSAFFILMITSILITIFYHLVTGSSVHISFVNAIPLSVISSAIAIPSVSGLMSNSKEFVIFESSISDILAIILFNFALTNSSIELSSFVTLAGETLITLLYSVAFSLVMLYLLGKISHNVKYFLIIALLFLVYGIGKEMHLSALILVVSFGLFLSNINQINISFIKKYFYYENFKTDLKQFHLISAESSFIIRTFFFVMFGFTLDFNQLLKLEVIFYAIGVLILIYFIRYYYLKTFVKRYYFRELTYIAPRGLISILLYFNIPEEYKIASLEVGILFMVVILSSLVMTISLMSTKKIKADFVTKEGFENQDILPTDQDENASYLGEEYLSDDPDNSNQNQNP